MPDQMRAVIDTLIPPGSAWRVAPGEDLDNLYDGMAENWEVIREYLSELSAVRDPNFTTFLADLEREFGVLINLSLTDTQRREQLLPIVYSRGGNGGIDDLQNALDSAGFSALVHSNDPAVDPAIFLDQAFVMTAGHADAFAGGADAYAARLGGTLLVNGEVYATEKSFDSVAGTFYAGDGTGAGEFTNTFRAKNEYPIPTDPGDWPLVFFVGGVAVRDGAGALVSIEQANVPSAQEQEFKRIILRHKPLHSWAGLIINYT